MCSINPVSDNKSESENESEEVSEDESEDESEAESEDKTVNTIAVHTVKILVHVTHFKLITFVKLSSQPNVPYVKQTFTARLLLYTTSMQLIS